MHGDQWRLGARWQGHRGGSYLFEKSFQVVAEANSAQSSSNRLNLARIGDKPGMGDKILFVENTVLA
jgi:hypothetical protein